MFFNVVCYCGSPICELYKYFILAKLLTFQDQADNVEKSVQTIKNEFGLDAIDYVIDFLFVSFDHLNIYQSLDKKKAIKDLLKQYAEIYPFEDMAIPPAVQAKIQESKGVEQFLQSIYTVIERIRGHDVRRYSNRNLVKELLDSAGVKKQCCRQTILTFVDFYQSRDAFSSILH